MYFYLSPKFYRVFYSLDGKLQWEEEAHVDRDNSNEVIVCVYVYVCVCDPYIKVTQCSWINSYHILEFPSTTLTFKSKFHLNSACDDCHVSMSNFLCVPSLSF